MASTLFNGREWHLRRFGGASGTRVSHAPGNIIDEHRHDWLNITIHLLGACEEEAEPGTFHLDGPSVTLLPAGSHHANRIGQHGLETIGLLLDPAWLGRDGPTFLPDRALNLCGGRIGIAARQLAAMWMNEGVSEAELAAATASFMVQVRGAEPVRQPSWLGQVVRLLESEPSIGTNRLAERVGLNSAWLARAYRHAVGEGLADTVRRRRVERALRKVRTTDASLAEIALASGFCDQAHMNRCFAATLGQTPLAVRAVTMISPRCF